MKYFSSCLALSISSTLMLITVTTHAQQVQVPIDFHQQEHTLSCEIAALKMALGSHNITVNEDTLITQLPFDTTPKQPGVWGNPHQGFVGDINGRMLVSGYGVYWEPIAAVGNRYVHTKILQPGTAPALAQSIAAGNPVIVWGHYGPLTNYSWQTPTRETIQAVDGEHTRVAYGFDGPVNTPTHFYLMDPSFGLLRWSTAELLANWRSLNYAAVVVTQHPRWVRLAGDTKVWEINREGTVRRWVTTWATLQKRSGGTPFITTVDARKLAAYSVGAPIE